MNTLITHARGCAWFAAIGLTLAAFVAPLPTHGATAISWHIQNTGFAGGRNTAVAMRNGGAWPVIFDEFANAYSLFATEGPNPGSNWHQIGSNLLFIDGAMNIKTGPDGQFALIGGFWENPAGVVSGPQGGWTSLPSGTTAVAFDNDGNLLTARFDGSSTGFVLPSGVETTFSIDVSKYGDIGLFGSYDDFYELNHLLGTWQVHNLQAITQEVNYLSPIVYDSFARPHFLRYKYDGNIEGVHFDTQSASWVVSPVMYVSPGIDMDAYLMLASNDDGVVGTAFALEGILYYAYKDKNAAWAVTVVDSAVDDVRQVGITYDFEGLPVIAYSKNDLIYLAYDPLVTITPALAGDLNNDGFVGLDDLNIILGQWNTSVSPNSQADPSGDGYVGIEDLNTVLGNWNAGTLPPADATHLIPVPATALLLAAGAIGFACKRGRGY